MVCLQVALTAHSRPVFCDATRAFTPPACLVIKCAVGARGEVRWRVGGASVESAMQRHGEIDRFFARELDPRLPW